MSCRVQTTGFVSRPISAIDIISQLIQCRCTRSALELLSRDAQRDGMQAGEWSPGSVVRSRLRHGEARIRLAFPMSRPRGVAGPLTVGSDRVALFTSIFESTPARRTAW